jgi:hypothetical protein
MNTSISSEITHRTGPHQSETIDAVLALRSNTDLADVEPAEDDTETFLRELTAEALAHRALHHPYPKVRFPISNGRSAISASCITAIPGNSSDISRLPFRAWTAAPIAGR